MLLKMKATKLKADNPVDVRFWIAGEAVFSHSGPEPVKVFGYGKTLEEAQNRFDRDYQTQSQGDEHDS